MYTHKKNEFKKQTSLLILNSFIKYASVAPNPVLITAIIELNT